ncbi:uncharacterized protein LOC110850584 isoform X1 [Folsomia candida]|uniref:uncharacterized protein LOC110850584 isoform X1 n=1 Tax=Folsomia candida TaxID=158441 RepID=UPI001604E622|nr:uncharacterized protein LOC110850584 isoform X1 [Folsomia candida]
MFRALFMEKLCLLVIFCCLSCVVTESDGDSYTTTDLKNYVATAVLPDGEHEVRMRLGNVLVRETFVTNPTQEGDDEVRRGLMLRQVASGPHFLQLIYKLNYGTMTGSKHRKLVECEVINDWKAGNEFRSQFRRELVAQGLQNLGVPANRHVGDDEDSDDLIMAQLLDESSSNSLPDVEPIDLNQGLDEFKNVTVRLLRDTEVSDNLRKTFNVHAQQRQCKRLHQRMKQAVKSVKDAKLSSSDDEDASNSGVDGSSSSSKRANYTTPSVVLRRTKRDMSTLQLPGTQWCGRGYTAKDMTQLGGLTGTDNCCRYHDLGCPFYIEAFQEKYGLFNWRMYTINHCTCDERFRSCLKQTNTGSSNFVGKIFFNVVQTKCFLLKPERTCSKMSWFGKCLKYEYKKQAHLRDPIPY